MQNHESKHIILSMQTIHFEPHLYVHANITSIRKLNINMCTN